MVLNTFNGKTTLVTPSIYGTGSISDKLRFAGRATVKVEETLQAPLFLVAGMSTRAFAVNCQRVQVV
jgi:hypothetical protein